MKTPLLLRVQRAESNRQLVWHDDFDSAALDRSKWECEVNAFGGGNNELQIYTDYPKNVRVENGCLVLEAHREPTGIQGTVREWSSGRVRTKHRGDWTYGLFEARIKLPKGQGFWPAFWMLPTDEKYGPWAASGEIDIMEAVGQHPDKVSCALHFGGTWPRNKFLASVPSRVLDTPREPLFTDAFHEFALLWNRHSMQWFVDDVPVWELERKQWCGDTLEDGYLERWGDGAFDERFHILLNLAVGGNMPGNPDHTTPPVARMEVDWVRVWQ